MELLRDHQAWLAIAITYLPNTALLDAQICIHGSGQDTKDIT